MLASLIALAVSFHPLGRLPSPTQLSVTPLSRLRLAVDADALGPDEDPWEIVGAPRTATMEEIRRQYRERARKIHPDVGGDAAAFRKLVAAFEMLLDTGRRSAWDTARKRSTARERANRQWDDIGRRSRWRDGGSASERPAGSRYDAERQADTREQSESRRERWRQMAFDGVYREHMPIDFVNAEAKRVAFAANMEVAVQAFVRDGGASASGTSGGGAQSSQAEEEELRQILKTSNREVLRAELQDARHRASKHRERARWLEGEAALAAKKAAMWRGATPASQADRVQAMERELAFLELAERLRNRLSDQRLALQQLKGRERALTDRLATMGASSAPPR